MIEVSELSRNETDDNVDSKNEQDDHNEFEDDDNESSILDDINYLKNSENQEEDIEDNDIEEEGDDEHIPKDTGNPLHDLEAKMLHHNNNEEGEFHQIGSMLYASTENNSSENHMDFSDERTDGKVEIKRDSDGEVTFINQHDDYFYRPTALYFLNYLEFLLF